MPECPWTYTKWPQTLFLIFCYDKFFLRARELSPRPPRCVRAFSNPSWPFIQCDATCNSKLSGSRLLSRIPLVVDPARCPPTFFVDRPHWPRVCNRLKLDYTDVFTCDSQFLTTNVHSIIPAGSPQNTVFTTSIVLLSLVLKITCEKNKPVSSRSSSFSWLWRSIISRIKKRIFIQYNTRLYSRDKKKIKLQNISRTEDI